MNIGNFIDQLNQLVYDMIVSSTEKNEYRISLGILYVLSVYILLILSSYAIFSIIDVGLIACWIFSICSLPILAYSAIWGRIQGRCYILNIVLLVIATISPFVFPLIVFIKNM